jgi:diguanylate cyclase (GGDEF)-like protein/PAS domain S-box-containing protein
MALDGVDQSSLEADLRDRERQLEDAQALAHFGSWKWDLSRPTAVWSDALCRIFGRPEGFSPTCEQFVALVHPDDRASVEATISDAVDGKCFGVTGSYRIVRPDGEVRHVHGGRSSRTNARGEVTHLFGTIQDITEQRTAEIAQGEAQALFETAFSQATIGMALVGLDGRWLKVNAAACEITGWPEAELLARSFQDITHPDDLDADLAQVELLLAGKISGYRMQKRYITCAGSEIWVMLSVSLARDASGRPRHFISQLQDISGRKRDEERLQEAELEARTQRDHAKAIISAMHEGYALTVGGQIKTVNESLCTLTGFSEQELIGECVPFPFWPPELRSENMQLTRQIVDSLGGTFEVTLMRRNGERFVAEVTAELAFDPAGASIGLVNTVRDISIQRRQQRELERLARTDSLTGLANRYLLQESLDRAAAQAQRHGGTLALILLDVDWFKQVNDRHGHPAGDSVLVEVARRLTATVRAGEVLARVGGEEFAWLLPDAGAEEAATAADRARRAIAAVPFATAGHLTMSAGVGLMLAAGEGDALYRLADRALYDAKQRGRNRTSCLTGPAPAPDQHDYAADRLPGIDGELDASPIS